MFPLWVVAIACLASTHRSSAAGTTNVVCTTDLWSFNENNSSPCQVASDLQAVCNGGTWNINPLSQNEEYGGPFKDQSNKCVCATVVYCLVSACGSCQGGSIITWSQWKFNCTDSDITISQFPIPIPPDVAIPSWAFKNVTIADIWNATAAQAAHSSGALDSTAVPSATGVPASTGTLSKTSNHAGAIPGAVVGGVVGLTLIAGVFALMRRRTKGSAPPGSRGVKEMFDVTTSPSSYQGYPSPSVAMRTEPQTFYDSSDLSAYSSPSTRGFPSPTLPIQTERRKFYDPSDPSTFPNTFTPTLPSHVPATVASDRVLAYDHPQNPRSSFTRTIPRSQYTGVPEI